jgi:NAD(P)-dependent dehydrogenase (short-subunit alcohol dehydrogenase family)
MSGTNLFDLTGKVALVTGGSSGLGLGFATGIAKANGDVLIWGRDAQRNEKAVATLREYGGRVVARSVDVSSREAVVAGMAEAVEIMGRLDCVIANAGASHARPSSLDVTPEDYHALLATNLHGAFYTLQEGARHMVERSKAGDPGGSLIVCGSLTVFKGVTGMPHYGAAKGALAAIMASMAVEFGQYGIRVNMIAPGYIRTNIGASRDDPKRQAMDRRFAEAAPMARIGAPEDFEGIAAYLASDCSSFHTGDIIVIDGGAMVKV